MSGGEKKQLGKILLQRKLVAPAELSAVLEKEQGASSQRLASVLAASGRASQADLLKALSEQLGVPGFDITQSMIVLSCLDLIPHEIARRHRVLPVAEKQDCIFLAMADPAERRTIDEIEFVTGRRVFPFVALSEPLALLIDEAYRMRERGEVAYVGSQVPPELSNARFSQLSGEHAPESEDFKYTSLSMRSPEVVSGQPPPFSDLQALSTVGRGDERLATPTEKRSSTAATRILVVDDDADIRSMLVRALTDRGYQVLQASRGFEALEKIRDESPQLLLLDAQLPEVHGFDLCRRVRASKRYADVPVVVMSAVYRGWRVAEDLRATYGVQHFLEKPFSLASLFASLEHALGARESLPDMSAAVNDQAQGCLDAGLAAYARGEHEAALTLLKSGVALDALAFPLQYHLGLLLGGSEDTLFDAIGHLEIALELSPRSFSAAKNLAVLYERAGFTFRASELWQRALGLSTDAKIQKNIKEHLLRLL